MVLPVVWVGGVRSGPMLVGSSLWLVAGGGEVSGGAVAPPLIFLGGMRGLRHDMPLSFVLMS